MGAPVTNRPAPPPVTGAPPPLLVTAAVLGLLAFAAYFCLWPMQNAPVPRLLLPGFLLDYYAKPAVAPLPSGLRFLPQRLDLLAVAAAVWLGAAPAVRCCCGWSNGSAARTVSA